MTMKRIAHIKDGQIVNVSLGRDDAELAPGTMLEADALAAGMTYAPRVPADALPQRRSEMAAIFDALPIEHQAALFSTRVAVEQALDRGRLDIARQIVVAAVIPADLEPTRSAILALFPSSP